MRNESQLLVVAGEAQWATEREPLDEIGEFELKPKESRSN